MKTAKKRLFYSFLMLICLFSTSFAKAQSFTPRRGVLIFLDEGEQTIDAVSGALMIALYQNAGPIIATGSILATVFSEYKNQPTQQNPQKLADEFKKLYYENTPEAEKRQHAILLIGLAFNPKDWVIKEISPDLYLFIPQEHLDRLNINRILVEKTLEHSPITNTELRLGLKVNHMKTISFEEILALQIQNNEDSDYFINLLIVPNPETKKNDSLIFCTRSDYQDSSIPAPLWTIFFDGHGQMNVSIVNLTLESFKKVLEFLESRIYCNLVVYNSCYAAGLNAEIIFNDAKNGIQKAYSYAIITQAITDAPTHTVTPDLDIKNNQLIFISQINFKKFLEEATSFEFIPYAQAMKHLFPTTPLEQLYWGSSQIWGNVPQIKLPGLEWFSVMASPKEIVSIGSILSKARDPEKPLDIQRFFKTDPKALLLYSTDITFELIINSENMEAIISMNPGDTLHKLKRISSTKNDTPSIIRWFMKIIDLEPFKLFFIESINEVQNVVIYSKKTKPKPHIDIPAKFENFAFYEKNNEIFRVEFRGKFEEGGILPATDEQINIYRKLLDKIKGTIRNLGSFTIKSYHPQFPIIPEINESVIIEKIEGKNAVSIPSILHEVKMALSKNTIAWINQISGKYYTFKFFSLPDIPEDTSITLKNIVVDRQKGTFFTHQDNFYHFDKNTVIKIDYDYKDQFKKRMQEGIKESETGITKDELANIKKVLEQRVQYQQKEQKQIQNSRELFNALMENKPEEQLIEILEKGIDFSIKPADTPLLLHAIKKGNANLVKQMLEMGADANETDMFGNPILDRALNTYLQGGIVNQYQIVKSLLEHNANPNATDWNKKPLIFSALWSPKLLSLLLEYGADATSKYKGHSLLETAVSPLEESPNLEIIKVLIEAGAKPDFDIEKIQNQEIKVYLLKQKN